MNDTNSKDRSCGCGPSCGCAADCFAEKEKLTDSLNSQKQMTGVYNTYLNETATPELTQCLTGLLEEEHRIGKTLFEEMSKRGWYKTEAADPAKVQAARQQYGQKTTV